MMKKELLYLTDTSGVGLGAGLLKVRQGIICHKDTAPDNCIKTNNIYKWVHIQFESWYSNIEREVLGILQNLPKIQPLLFCKRGTYRKTSTKHTPEPPKNSTTTVLTRELHIDHKPLVAILKKDIAMLSQRLQCILLKIHQYKKDNI